MKRNKMRKLISVLATASVLSGLLVGCGSSNNAQPASNGSTGEHVKLTIWSHWGDQELTALKAVADEWAKQTGNEVSVVNDKGEFQAYATAARSGKGPDIEFGIPHDNLGTFAQANLLAEVPSGLINDSDYEPVALSAVTVNGKRVAFPFSMETYGLFYNTDKIQTPPTNWNDFIKDAQANGFMYDVNNLYFSYAFLSGNGGYVFKNNNGTYDTNDIGLGNDGSVAGLSVLQDFVQKYKFMPADVTGDIAKSKFSSKAIGMYISGPWDTGAMKQAGVNFAVAPLPTLANGQAPRTFVGVQTGFVSSKSQHQQQAWELMKYLSENGSKKFLDVGNRIPVLKSLLTDPSFKDNKLASSFAQIAATGEPMPNIPAMAAVWVPAGNNMKLVTSGKVDPKKAAGDIVTQVKQGIATQQ